MRRRYFCMATSLLQTPLSCLLRRKHPLIPAGFALSSQALAFTLFHKFYAAGVSRGLEEGRALAKDWLVGALVKAYRSAEKEEVRGRPIFWIAYVASSQLFVYLVADTALVVAG